MVSLSNQARLLAAQAFNKKVLEDKAKARQAEAEKERQEEIAKLTRRKQEALKTARNAVEAQRIRDSIAETLALKSTQKKISAINVEAKRKKQQAFTRVAKGANIGVLTGFEATKDSRGRTIGISKNISKTRKRTITLLQTEIARQEKIAREGTDLERFLRNEQAINRGQISKSELNRQIADRKKRGLSKTPAQKRASQFFRDSELSTALDARAKRKGTPSQRATFGQIQAERARATDLGSAPFLDPLFSGGGRSKKEIIARGGTFGRRVGGESIDSQLSFISSAKASSTSGRIGFAQSLLSNLNFTGSSQSSLLNIVGNKKIKTPKTFQATLREGVGFFTTEAVPVTKATAKGRNRGQLVAQRKAEDFAKTEKARKTIARQAKQTRQPAFDLDAFGASLDVSNLQRGRAIEAQNKARPPRFSLGLTVQRQQAQEPTGLSLIPTRSAFVGSTERVAKGQTLTPSQKRAQAQATQRETQLLRDTPFRSGSLVQASGRPSSTETFFPNIPSADRNVFNVNLQENIGVSDALSPTQTKKKTKGRGRTPTPPRDDFSALDLGSLISFGAVRPPTPPRAVSSPTPRARPTEDFDFTFGLGEAVRSGISGAREGATQTAREASGGIQDFFALDIGAGFGSEAQGSSFSFGEAVSASRPLLDTGFDFLR